ncbi:avidin-related protein 1-like [Protobothrops mucrosquamatus]|uniref:avidin-related protein 1-like n=1 Tax=Protobothrops mucrosquamatus TaxID=103944 RepID=UPI000775C0EC|nr:avidin-related protein 1-like [Protobothrops mucrosquamatus]
MAGEERWWRASRCSLTGTWKNDLNSTTETNSVSNIGVSNGLYQTAVSASDNPIRPSLLQVIQHQGPRPVVGLIIIWNLSDKKGMEQLKTTWLLHREVEPAAEDWGAPRVGSSNFYRSK